METDEPSALGQYPRTLVYLLVRPFKFLQLFTRKVQFSLGFLPFQRLCVQVLQNKARQHNFAQNDNSRSTIPNIKIDVMGWI